MRLLVVSDPHLAGPGEQARRGYEARAIRNPLLRLAARLWRDVFWLRDPLAHNDKLDRIVAANPDPDVVVANGDYTVNSAFVGISDDDACESALLCLSRLRTAYGGRLLVGIGDHELGKHSLFGGNGGVRLESWRRLASRLDVDPCWRRDFGAYALVSVPSTVVALPAFAPELLPEEAEAWRRERAEVLRKISDHFGTLPDGMRVVLFCHDPTALPFLREIPSLEARLARLEAVVIGHLHTPVVLAAARMLAGVPVVTWAGSTIRRYTGALNRARSWRDLPVRFCPSPAGSQLFKDGGWLTAEIDTTGRTPIRWARHRLRW